MASIIAPTILTSDFGEYQRLSLTYPSFAKRIQIDIADATFVATNTIQVANIPSLPDGIIWDLHMMVMHPSEHLGHIVRLRPRLVIFHAEANENLLQVIAQLKKAGIKAGVALLQRTYPGDVKAYIEAADHVLIFAGRLGKQGGTADLLQAEKIKLVKAINPNAEIGWDGGVNLENVRAISHAGVDVINVGSFISMNADPNQAYKALVDEADKSGVAL
jgi:ribulose-phosphate 3-epimerase